MSGDRPNSTETFRYLGNNIWPYLGPQSAIPSVYAPNATVYVVGSTVKAMDWKGNLISSGTFHTNDGAVIQAALNNIGSTGQGFGTLFIQGYGDSSANRYLIEQKLTLPNGGLTICGNGMEATVLYLNNNVNDHMFFYDGSADAYFITFKDMQLIGNSANNSGSSTGIYFGNTTNQVKDPLLFNMFVQDFIQYDFYHKSTWNDRLIGCIFEYGQNTGVYLDGGQDDKIVNCAFKFNKDGLNLGGTGAVQGSNVADCTFIQNTNRGIVIPNASTSMGSIVGCNFNQNGTQTANTYDDIQADSNRWVITGCNFLFGQQRYGVSSFSASTGGVKLTASAFSSGYTGIHRVNDYTKIDVANCYNVTGSEATSANGSTAGTITYFQSEILSGNKRLNLYCNAWQDAGKAVTYPVAFVNSPAILTDATGGATTTATTLTLPNTVGVAKTGFVIVEGY